MGPELAELLDRHEEAGSPAVGSLADAVDRAVRIALAGLASDQPDGRCRQFV